MMLSHLFCVVPYGRSASTRSTDAVGMAGRRARQSPCSRVMLIGGSKHWIVHRVGGGAKLLTYLQEAGDAGGLGDAESLAPLAHVVHGRSLAHLQCGGNLIVRMASAVHLQHLALLRGDSDQAGLAVLHVSKALGAAGGALDTGLLSDVERVGVQHSGADAQAL